jgi:hypothetical protein
LQQEVLLVAAVLRRTEGNTEEGKRRKLRKGKTVRVLRPIGVVGCGE